MLHLLTRLLLYLQSALAPLEPILSQEVPLGRQIGAFLLAGHHSGVSQHSHDIIRALQPATLADRSAGYVGQSSCTSTGVIFIIHVFLFLCEDFCCIIITCMFPVKSCLFGQMKQEVTPVTSVVCDGQKLILILNDLPVYFLGSSFVLDLKPV